MAIVELENLTKIYGKGATAVTALKDTNFTLNAGEFVAVMGPSGCGKSTLLHLVGGLDNPSSGRVFLNDQDVSQMNDSQLTEIRRRQIGFIFQFFNLIPVLTAVENAALPLILDGMKRSEAHNKATSWLQKVGLADRSNSRPDQLSGGQQQRVAIARALTAEPKLVLADEPTGNLDSRAADEIAALLRQIADEWGRAVLMVTHDPRIAAYADRIIFLKDGTVVDDTRLNGQMVEAENVREKVAAL
jgi:putative ABC transport system ATP-binding protein